MLHFNADTLCAIDCETTGLDPDIHEILELCIMPLDPRSLKPLEHFRVFIKPESLATIDPKAMSVNKLDLDKIMKYGKSHTEALDLFDKWFEHTIGDNKFGTKAKIMPLGHNYPFDRGFLMKFFGPKLYDIYFDYRIRDTAIAANFLNDHAFWHGERVPFNKVNLQWLAKKFNIEVIGGHTALGDCLLVSKIYKEMIRHGIFSWGG